MSRPEWIYGPSSTIVQRAVPDGAPFAQYLNVGGATVDIANVAGHTDQDRLTHTQAICLGCGALHAVEWLYDGQWDNSVGDFARLRDEGGERAIPQVRNWAQAHASTCRAMPTPEATR